MARIRENPLSAVQSKPDTEPKESQAAEVEATPKLTTMPRQEATTTTLTSTLPKVTGRPLAQADWTSANETLQSDQATYEITDFRKRIGRLRC